MVLPIWIAGSVLLVFFIPFMQEIGMEGHDMTYWIFFWPVMVAGKLVTGAVRLVSKAMEK